MVKFGVGHSGHKFYVNMPQNQNAKCKYKKKPPLPKKYTNQKNPVTNRN